MLFTTDGHTTTFQLTKTYSDPGGVYVRDIFKPVAGTMELLDNGVPTAAWIGGHDDRAGDADLASLTTGHLITGNCEFDVPVRFTTDSMVVSITDIDNFAWGQIPLMEVRDI